MGADRFLPAHIAGSAGVQGTESFQEVRPAQQVYDCHAKTAQQAVGKFGRKVPRALQYVVDLRLRDA